MDTPSEFFLRKNPAPSKKEPLAFLPEEGGFDEVEDGRSKKSLSVKRGIGILIVSYTAGTFLVHSEDSLEEEDKFEEES